MSAPGFMYDLFITHAWRYHDDWNRLSALLNAKRKLSWRNFSVPWYDPALDPNTEIGGRLVREWLEGQIRPVVAVIFLDSVFKVKSNRRWVELEVGLGRDLGKPVIGLPAFGEQTVSAEGQRLIDVTVAWNPNEIIAAVDRFLASAPAVNR